MAKISKHTMRARRAQGNIAQIRRVCYDPEISLWGRNLMDALVEATGLREGQLDHTLRENPWLRERLRVKRDNEIKSRLLAVAERSGPKITTLNQLSREAGISSDVVRRALNLNSFWRHFPNLPVDIGLRLREGQRKGAQTRTRRTNRKLLRRAKDSESVIAWAKAAGITAERLSKKRRGEPEIDSMALGIKARKIKLTPEELARLRKGRDLIIRKRAERLKRRKLRLLKKEMAGERKGF